MADAPAAAKKPEKRDALASATGFVPLGTGADTVGAAAPAAGGVLRLTQQLVSSGVLSLSWDRAQDADAAAVAAATSVCGDRPPAPYRRGRTRVRRLVVAATARYNPETRSFVADLCAAPHLVRDAPIHHEAAMRLAAAEDETGDEARAYCARVGREASLSAAACRCRCLIQAISIEGLTAGWEFPHAYETPEGVRRPSTRASGSAELRQFEDETQRSAIQADCINLIRLAEPVTPYLAAFVLRPRVWLTQGAGGATVDAFTAEAPCAYLCDAWGGVVPHQRSGREPAHRDPMNAATVDLQRALGRSLPFRDVLTSVEHAKRAPTTVFRVPYAIPPALYFMWMLRSGVPPVQQVMEAMPQSGSGATAEASRDDQTLDRLWLLLELAKFVNLARLDGGQLGPTQFNPASFGDESGVRMQHARAAVSLMRASAGGGMSEAQFAEKVWQFMMCIDPAPVVRLARAVAATLFPVWAPDDELRLELGLTPADAIITESLATLQLNKKGPQASASAATASIMHGSGVRSGVCTQIRAVLRFNAYITVRFVHCDP